MKITHVINWHIHRNLLKQALNFIPSFKKKNIYEYHIKFTESCKYCESELNQIIMGEDCKDWSKLLGISFSPFLNAKKNSVMLAWRHHPEEGLQIQPYVHLPDGEAVHTIFPPLNVKVGVTYRVIINTNRRYIWIIPNDKTELKSWYYPKEVKRTEIKRQINTWFGGNRPAPQNIEIYIEQTNFKNYQYE